MGIVAVILGIISLVAYFLLLSPSDESGIAPILAIGSLAAVVGLILGIIALVKSKPKKRMAIAGVVICFLGIWVSTTVWLIVYGAPDEDWGPSWSPDGSHITFSSGRAGSQDIYVIDADGSNLQRLTDKSANDLVGSCALAPVMVVNDKVYGRMTPDKVKKVIGNRD